MYHDIERHEMELVRTHPNGAEEWLCPTCKRRFIMQWPPNYKRVILEAGDEDAIHSGGKGGAYLSPPQTGQAEQDYETDEQSAPYGALDFRPRGERGNEDGDSGLSPIFLAAIDELDFSPLFGNLEDGDDRQDEEE